MPIQGSAISTEHALSVRWNRLPEQNYAESMLRKLSRSEGPTVIRAVTLSVQGAATGLYVDKEDTERHPSGAILDAVIHGEEEPDMLQPPSEIGRRKNSGALGA